MPDATTPRQRITEGWKPSTTPKVTPQPKPKPPPPTSGGAPAKQ